MYWDTDCKDIRTTPYTARVMARDNECVNPEKQILTFNITVRERPNFLPKFTFTNATETVDTLYAGETLNINLTVLDTTIGEIITLDTISTNIPFNLPRPEFNKTFHSPGISVENRNLSGFSKIEVSGAFQIKIIKSNTYGVKVEADDEIMKNILTEVNGDKLVVKLLYKDKSSYNKTKVLNITVQTPSLTALTCSGAVEASSDDIFDAEKFELKTSGASEVKLGINAKLLISKFSSV